MCVTKNKLVLIQTEMGASTTDSYPMENMIIKTDIQKLEDVLPMEQ